MATWHSVGISLSLLAVGLSPALLFAQGVSSPENSQQTRELANFFESKIRPVLVEHCLSCHGPQKQKGQLRLDSKEALLKGGESGPAILPGKPAESMLVRAIQFDGLEMPPKGKLPPEKIKDLVTWVKEGAHWPIPQGGKPTDENPKNSGTHGEGPGSASPHWAFQLVRLPPVPPLKPGESAKNPLDAFIQAKLNQAGIQPVGPASSRELVRRLFFDLTGLPPTPEEIRHWSAKLDSEKPSSTNAGAYATLIDELLQRPAYGERWGRHWLDVVRFAQSNGYERDGFKPFSWRYRDYVINAFQNDKPYSRFVEEQLAGDELPDSGPEARTATGFYRLGVWDDEPDDKRQAEFEDLDDIMVTTGAAFLGLTLGCARCHDHKFDPIPQADYYRLLAFVRNLRPYAAPDQKLDNASLIPVSPNQNVLASASKLRQQRQQLEEKIKTAPSETERKKLEAQLQNDSLPGLDWALGARERKVPLPTHILIRGNASAPGQEVQPEFPKALAFSETSSPAGPPSPSPLNAILPTCGRRIRLARWITNKANPLTARVMVNRIWHYHFGRGIVASTGDFGKAGTPPTHPELLDWLAWEFMEKGWSVKHLHRVILKSDTYRRSSHFNHSDFASKAQTIDPGNQFLWRQNLRRLDAEAIRDGMLAASGELNPKTGGPEMYPRLGGEVLAAQSKPGLDWELSPTEDQKRRSVYAMVKRGVRDPLLEAFDYSNTTSPLTERPLTTISPQALLLLNNRFSQDRAAALAKRVRNNPAQTPDQVIRNLFWTTLGREPNDREIALALGFLAKAEASYLHMAGQIRFQPDVPASLFSAYRQKLRGEDFLIGPRAGWDYFPGLWGGGYEGIDVVDPSFGPFALWNGPPMEDGTISGKFLLDKATQKATLLVRAEKDGNKWSGIGLTFDAMTKTTLLREVVKGNERKTQVAPFPSTGDWHSFRLQLEGNTIRFWIGEDYQASPWFERKLTTTLPNRGRFGISTWGGPLTLDGLRVSQESSSWDVARCEAPNSSGALPLGWTPYGGDWSLLPNNQGVRVAAENGPKLILDKESLQDGEVRVELKFTKGKAAIGGLILRVSEPKVGADNWYGHEVSLDAGTQRVFVGDHRNNWTPIADAPTSVEPGKWHSLRVILNGPRMQVFVDGKDKPTIDKEIQPPLDGTMIGLRTWGSDLEFRNLEVTHGGAKTHAEWLSGVTKENPRRGTDTEWAKGKALESLCRSMFNLNEFVYVD